MITETQRDAARERASRPSGIQREIDTLGWRDVARELHSLGYVASTPTEQGDFTAQDDRDGRGPYVAAWHSFDPFPLESDLLRPPETPEARRARLEELLVNKPYIHTVSISAPVAEFAEQLQYAIVVANHVKGPDGELQKLLSPPLTLAQAKALGFTDEQIDAFVPAAALAQVAAAEARADETMVAASQVIAELRGSLAETQAELAALKQSETVQQD